MSSPLIVVPCRWGSRGIPMKNFKPFCERPLWKWTQDVVEELGWPVVWTADHLGAAKLVSEGVEAVESPAHGDHVAMVDIVLDAALRTEGDPIVLLQPTTPTRTATMVRQGVQILGSDDRITGVVAVAPVDPAASPGYLGQIDPTDLSIFFPAAIRRQQTQPFYQRTGAFYVVRRKTLISRNLYGVTCRPWVHHHPMPPLDEPEQWVFAEAVAKALQPGRFNG